ncbi:MAG: hypothetical protein JWR90_4084 [Marmoricola sp.]|jgi:hypothetical protein|nr:hypothetical protein [Marmoricola sp.]
MPLGFLTAWVPAPPRRQRASYAGKQGFDVVPSAR